MHRVPRIVIYTKSLRHLIQNSRSFSSESLSRAYISSLQQKTGTSSKEGIREREICLLGPEDPRAPLPGNIGIPSNLVETSMNFGQSIQKSTNCDVLNEEMPEQRHRRILNEVLANENEENSEFVTPSINILECVAQECPQLMKKDFKDLFPSRDLMHGNLTVITFSQKTNNDMSAWSPDVEWEREDLMKCFSEAAELVCTSLEEAGYWADFIDPSSGRPKLGPYTNDALFETDERYCYFGFIIEDLGCCKVISHHLWGTHAFVGCIFTNAPFNGPQVKNIIQMHNK